MSLNSLSIQLFICNSFIVGIYSITKSGSLCGDLARVSVDELWENGWEITLQSKWRMKISVKHTWHSYQIMEI